MAKVYLGLGSNINAEENLRRGIRELRRRFGQLDVSSVYRSAAVGFEGDDFLNLVVGLDTDETPLDINGQIEAIHRIVGRQRGEERFSSRALDIDLLLYDDLILHEPPLCLPRTDVLDYSFVLRPLAELAPDLTHPETGRTLAEHWQAFDERSQPLTPVRVIL
ncbi:MAG: 2-amino-4-hydroxy-6-hydroxymethyldihydropteridine diphosphokinase [Gammaproteobacteria bacterium]|nr:2-amino-4-hydroxy-6-hydroxymethyldihydropteridine diphosphokinase [Gammaproteobacteria bacterium]